MSDLSQLTTGVQDAQTRSALRKLRAGWELSAGELGALEARVTALESGGWHPIASGQVSGSSQIGDLSFTAGLYSQLRLRMHGSMSTVDTSIILRVNGSASAGLYRRSLIRRRASDGTVTAAAMDDGNAWFLGQWSTQAGCTLEANLESIDGTNTVGFNGTAHQVASSAASNIKSEAWGRLNTSTLVSSIRILPSSGTFNASYWLEGYVA